MSLKHLNILLADDDMDDCIFFKDALKNLLITTKLTTVHDGEQLMQLLANEPREHIDVLFLDLNMPRKNGFECLLEIKASERLKQLPVIIFSTSFEKEVVNLLYKNGAQYFIRKPSEFSQFKKIVYQTLIHIAEENREQPTKDDFVLTIKSSLTNENPLKTTILDKKEIK